MVSLYQPMLGMVSKIKNGDLIVTPDIMTMTALERMRALVKNADSVLLFAGAGLSSELAVPTYWTGPQARYAEAVSEHGYSELEHATENLWYTKPEVQTAYFTARNKALLDMKIDTLESPYVRLLTYLETTQKRFFAVTTNVDSFFVRSGFPEDSLYEVHGAYRYSQCLSYPSKHGVFPTFATGEPTPCPICDSLTRPNVLFFDDFHRNPTVYNEQKGNYDGFRKTCIPNRTLVLEMGAGNTVPTLRNMSVLLNANMDFPVIRVNPNRVEGVDGIANMVPKSLTAPFITLQTTVSKALDAILV